MNTPISIIVVSYNTRELLRGCLNSVRAHAGPSRTIVVDNASQDGSAEMLRTDFADIESISLKHNVGFGPANNLAFASVQTPYFLLLNSDAQLTPGAVDACLQLLEQDSSLAAVSPRLHSPNGDSQQVAHPFPSLKESWQKFFRTRSTHAHSSAEPTWLAGTSLFLRTAAIRSLGHLFDERLFLYWEDCDLSARLLKAGWQLAVCQSASVLHHGGASGGGADLSRRPQMQLWYAYGRELWFAKHRPAWESWSICALDAIDSVRMAARGLVHADRRFEWNHARCMRQALWHRLSGTTPAPISPQ